MSAFFVIFLSFSASSSLISFSNSFGAASAVGRYSGSSVGAVFDPVSPFSYASLRLSAITDSIIASSSAIFSPFLPASGLSKSKAQPCTLSLLVLLLAKKLGFNLERSKPPAFFFLLAAFNFKRFFLCSSFARLASRARASAPCPFTPGLFDSSSEPSSFFRLSSNLR